MEVFDGKALRLADYERIFRYGVPRVSGTELSRDIARDVAQLAHKHGFRLSHSERHDGWVAAHRDVIVNGTWREYHEHVLDSAPAVGDPHPYSGKGVDGASWEEREVGARVGLVAGHFLTKGRWRGQAQQDHPGDPVDHFQANTIYAHAFGRWAEKFGDGPNLAFVGIDTNLVDERVDVFRGAPLTTAADEVDSYPASGHGGVDVIGSYNGDGRVRATHFGIAPNLHLHSDHKPVLARFRVKPRKDDDEPVHRPA